MCVTKSVICLCVCVCVMLQYMLHSTLAFSLFKHLHIHAERLLNGVFGDEANKVLDVSLSVGHQLVNGWLPHHGLGDLSGVVCEVNRCTVSSLIPKVELMDLQWPLDGF